MAKAKKITTDLNPLSAGVATMPPSATDVVQGVAQAAKLIPQTEQTPRQDDIYNGLMGLGMGVAGFQLPVGAFFGSQPCGGAELAPFYNGFGAIALNGYGLPLGTFTNYWMMERNPTVALAEAAADAPIRAAEITYESRDGTPKERVDFIRSQMECHERDLLDQLTYARGWGCRQAELVYKTTGIEGRTRLVLDKPKWLMPDLTVALRDQFGNLVGLENQGVRIEDTRRFIWLTYDGKGTNPYGRSRKENCKKPWLREESLYDILEYAMNVNVRPFGYVEYPYNLKDQDGNSLNDKMKANASAIAQNLSAARFALVPNPFAPWMEEMIQKGIDISKVMPYKIGWYDNKNDSGEGFERMFKITSRGIVMGILQPPRTILEGPGTQADAETHTDTGVQVNEIFLANLCREVNRIIIDTLLVQNFGEYARGSVYWKPSPMVDRQMTFNNDMVKQVLGSDIGPVLLKNVVQLASIFEKSGVKIAEFDQEKLVQEAQDAADQKAQEERAHELTTVAAKKGDPIKASMELSTADDTLDTIVDSHNRLTAEQRKRRKQFLLLLLGFFAWQGHELTSGVRADDPKFNARLGAVIRDGMMFTPQTFDTQPGMFQYADAVTKQATDIAEKINATTAKSIETAVDSGQAIAAAVDAIYKRSIEQRAATIEDDMTHVAEQIATQVKSSVAQRELVWKTADDEKVCQVCGPLHGLVAKVGEPFAPGVYLPTVNTHSNCRCTVELVPEVAT